MKKEKPIIFAYLYEHIHYFILNLFAIDIYYLYTYIYIHTSSGILEGVFWVFKRPFSLAVFLPKFIIIAKIKASDFYKMCKLGDIKFDYCLAIVNFHYKKKTLKKKTQKTY